MPVVYGKEKAISASRKRLSIWKTSYVAIVNSTAPAIRLSIVRVKHGKFVTSCVGIAATGQQCGGKCQLSDNTLEKPATQSQLRRSCLCRSKNAASRQCGNKSFLLKKEQVSC